MMQTSPKFSFALRPLLPSLPLKSPFPPQLFLFPQLPQWDPGPQTHFDTSTGLKTHLWQHLSASYDAKCVIHSPLGLDAHDYMQLPEQVDCVCSHI